MSDEQDRLLQMSGADRAAVMLLALGKESASDILRHMDDRVVTKITTAMTRIKHVGPEDLGSIADKFLADAQTDQGLSGNGINYPKSVLEMAFGEAAAAEILNKIIRNSQEVDIEVLANADPKSLAEQMALERPQTIALLIAHMGRDAAAALLGHLPDAVRSEALYRFALLEEVSPFAVQELKTVLSENLTIRSDSRRSASSGGARQAADVLNHLAQPLSEQILSALDKTDKGTADRIRENMFTFSDLMKLSDRAMQIMIREAAPDKIAPALRGASAELRDKFLRNMSARSAEGVKDEIDNGAQMRRADVLLAQKSILDVTMKLASEGTIVINSAEEML